ncbi:rhodanese-like domain-containing protein [Iodobacter ciconiae]|uniref:Rhodanese-like domain-containing protein n=1 Tax=Iodobacter ciconiae TaxID=2496266 RepID=A0A3S8ZTJ4_9NEIS|nr:rhodanese-like domain-containing protein [Iodobacter ciconiae]AZN36827.1 rhodanese-like domain-containing protein [Iodobacter ciconiae]
MSHADTILQQAHERALLSSLPYRGALTPAEAAALLAALPDAKLVDVRTHAEWQFVGFVPDSEMNEWKHYPEMDLNPHFLSTLQATVAPQAVVMFLCRTGARSHDAAMLAAANGYSNAFNILEGFEGDKNTAGQRGQVNGWKAAGLTWTQG